MKNISLFLLLHEIYHLQHFNVKSDSREIYFIFYFSKIENDIFHKMKK